MANTNNKIELKRGIYKICSEKLMEAIASLDDFETFYFDIFDMYQLSCNTEVFRQKRAFVAAATKYYILDRLPKDILITEDDKYSYANKCDINQLLSDVIRKFYEIHDSCESYTEFIKKYADYYNVEVRDFSKEISENRDDSLSDFAKAVQNVYNYKDDNKA